MVDLVPGDLVDVIRVDEEEASFVATGVTVLDVPGESEERWACPAAST